MDGLRTGKYAVRAASIVVEVFIFFVVGGPLVGAVSPELGVQHGPGLGIDLQAIQPQLDKVFSSGPIANGTHDIIVPAFNNWPLAGSASLTLSLIDGNRTLYETQPSTISLAPFKSGNLDVSMVLTQGLITQLQGQNLTVGGSMSIHEGQFWAITVSLAR